MCSLHRTQEEGVSPAGMLSHFQIGSFKSASRPAPRKISSKTNVGFFGHTGIDSNLLDLTGIPVQFQQSIFTFCTQCNIYFVQYLKRGFNHV